jgi:hypothetical protein
MEEAHVKSDKLSLSLFDLEPEEVTAASTPPPISAHIPGFEKACPETQEALVTMVQVAHQAATEGRLPGQVTKFDPHPLAFVGVCRSVGLTDSALESVSISGVGRRQYDERELARLANEHLTGIRSDRPSMTPERWREAGRKVLETHVAPPAWHVCIFEEGRLSDCHAYFLRKDADAALGRLQRGGRGHVEIEPCDGNPDCTACFELRQEVERQAVELRKKQASKGGPW